MAPFLHPGFSKPSGLRPPPSQLLSHDNIVNTYAHDLRHVDNSVMGLPESMMAAHWKMYIIQVRREAG